MINRYIEKSIDDLFHFMCEINGKSNYILSGKFGACRCIGIY